MTKLQVTFTDDKVLFLDTKTTKSEGFAFFAPMENKDAVKELRKEVDGRTNVSRAVLSLAVQFMAHERLAGYKGKTPIGERIPKEFKAALRDVEGEFLRPMVLDAMPKNIPDEERALKADKYMSELRAGGVYPLVKNVVSQYFAYIGQLPCVYGADGRPDTGKLLSIDAMRKLLANAREDAAPNNQGLFKSKFVNRAVQLAEEWKNQPTDAKKPVLDELRSGVAALKSVISEWEKLITAEQGSTSGVATKVSANDAARSTIGAAAKASKAPAKELEPALV